MKRNKGIWLAIGAYSTWGLFPIYWKLLHSIPALEIVANRFAWSLVFMALLLSFRRDWAALRGTLNRRTVGTYLVAALLLAGNWLIYIWAVNSGFIIESSLGYFINPLVNFLLGVVFFHERIPMSKWLPIGLATVGVVYLTVSYGSLPWISLALALSFGLYGMVKKLAPLGSMTGLTLETGLLFIPCLAYLIFFEMQGSGPMIHASLDVWVLLVLSGVITAVPLLMFATAAHQVPLSTLGLIQFLSPSLQFALGVFIYGEHFSIDKLIGFSIIWLALILFTVGGLYENRHAVSTSLT